MHSLRTFDAVLLAAYALHNYTMDGHALPGSGEPRGTGVCHDACAKVAPYGEKLLDYMIKVLTVFSGLLSFSK